MYSWKPGQVMRFYPHTKGTTSVAKTLMQKLTNERFVYTMVSMSDDPDSRFVHRGRIIENHTSYGFLERRAHGDALDYLSTPKRAKDSSLLVRLKMAMEMVRGMRFLHNHHVFMKDFKLENCLLFRKKDGSLMLRVADFNIVQHGVVQLYSGVDETMRCRGTFLAPEEQCKESSVGLAADIYRVGHALYLLFFVAAHEEKTRGQEHLQWDHLFPTLLDGRAFDGDGSLAVREQLIQLWKEDPLVRVDRTTLTCIGTVLDRLILPMLQKDPTERVLGFVSMNEYWTYMEGVIHWIATTALK